MAFDPFQNGYGCDDFFRHLRKNLPDVFTRQVAAEKIGGIFSAMTLSNLDSAGKGPTKRMCCGAKVIYEKENFISWLESKLRPERENINCIKRENNHHNYYGMVM